MFDVMGASAAVSVTWGRVPNCILPLVHLNAPYLLYGSVILKG